MKKSLRYICLLLAMVFLLTGSLMLVCYADEDVNQTGENQTGENQTGENQTGEDPPVEDPPVEDPPVEDPPAEEPPVAEPPVNDQPGENTGYDTGDDDNGNYSDNSYVYEEDPFYYGDTSNYNYSDYYDDSAIGSISSNTTLYNSSGMSEEEAAPNKWSDITLDEKSIKAGISDFSAIKSNTEASDNGDWILYLGYVLIALSILGVLYFVFATLAYRKAAQKAARRERRHSSAPAHTAAAKADENKRRTSSNAQRTSRFADEAPSHSRRSSSKADTGEIYIPRRTAKRTR